MPARPRQARFLDSESQASVRTFPHLLVDAERGILLRCASRLGNEDFDALEVEEVFFDEEFGQEMFDRREPLSGHRDT